MTVRVDTPGLQYDINAIVKAFYPDKEIRVLEPGAAMSAADQDTCNVWMDVRVDDAVINVEGTDHVYSMDSELGPKNSFKLALYDVMCDITGRTLPWGNLTGVRPTKIAMTGMRDGSDDEQVLEYMMSHHKVSPAKAHLALDIAHREADILSKIDHRHGYSLYLNIPFCPTTCLYCSFTSYPYAAWKSRADEYLDALFTEIDYVADEIIAGTAGTDGDGAGRTLCGCPDSIYIGGGTPTSLDEEHLERLLKYLTDRIDISRCLEFTCEAGRPDSITRRKLDILKRYGVTRISVNPQTMQQKTLDIIGRKATPGQVIEAFRMAREAGFDNINMDIILGLPGEGKDEVSDTLERISELNPDSLTVHSLAIKRASALREHLDEIGIEALVNTEETMALAADCARDLGMKPYYLYRQKNMSGNFENTGYAVPGKECIYNILIMEEVQSIVALGAGAISKRVDYKDGSASPIKIERAENPKDIENYIMRTGEMIERKRALYG